MTDRDQLIAEVKDIIAENLGMADKALITMDSTLSDLGFDSLDVVELELVLEDKYDRVFVTEDQDDFHKVEDIVNRVEKILQTSASRDA